MKSRLCLTTMSYNLRARSDELLIGIVVGLRITVDFPATCFKHCQLHLHFLCCCFIPLQICLPQLPQLIQGKRLSHADSIVETRRHSHFSWSSSGWSRFYVIKGIPFCPSGADIRRHGPAPKKNLGRIWRPECMSCYKLVEPCHLFRQSKKVEVDVDSDC